MYTQDNNRRWVKNRSGTGLCKGVNVNRNMETAGWGSAGINECADDYQAKFISIFIDVKYIILFRFLSKS